VATKYILAVLAIGFIAAALTRLSGVREIPHSQVRAWLLIGIIFGSVSAWLFYQG
jgi:Co/Zn/Cd efflux system component